MPLKRQKLGSYTVHASEHFQSALLFVLGAMSSILLPAIVIAVYSGPFSFPFILFFICSSLGFILGFAFYVPRVRLFRQRETVRLLKTQHKEFFRQIRFNVTRLLKKGEPDERLLTGRPYHVEEAREVLSRERKRRWYRELLIVFGSALFGAFIPGFITELSTGHQLLTVVYTAMGFSGMLLLFLGLRR